MNESFHFKWIFLNEFIRMLSGKKVVRFEQTIKITQNALVCKSNIIECKNEIKIER